MIADKQNLSNEKWIITHNSNDKSTLHKIISNGRSSIRRFPLGFDITRSHRDHDNQDKVQQRFKHSRFIFFRNIYTPKSSIEHEIKCKSCSLVKDQSFYEWELIDLDASQKAMRFRNDLKPLRMKGLLKTRVYSIDKGYLNERLCHLSLVERNNIRNSFKQAGKEDNPFYILTAYTTCQKFSKLLNTDMARNVIHDLKNGCSKFCCECLYSTEDGTKSIATILLYHPQFENLNFIGEVYRGLVIKESVLSHYTEGSYIITTTFLSTSKNRLVAEIFSGQNDPLPHMDDISCLFIYTIKTTNRTALDIAEYSEFKDEDEVLILPYSSFKITKIIRYNQQHRIELYLEE